MTLKIEVGKFYRTRDGLKVGPMVTDDVDGLYWKVEGTGRPLWSPDGRRWLYDPDRDLIAEWTDEPKAPDLTAITTPDYNDGNWHGWNGGECPVHPQSVVEYVWHDTDAGKAGFFRDWAGPLIWSNLIRFRVVKSYTEPREWWIVGDCEAYDSEADAFDACKSLVGNPTPVHVREVKE